MSSPVFPDFLRPLVEDLLSRESPNGRAHGDKLLQMNRDNFYAQYHATLQEICVRDLPPYSCRHTYGTEAVKAQTSPEVVRQLLRHSTILMQQRYTHLSSDAAHDAANALRKG